MWSSKALGYIISLLNHCDLRVVPPGIQHNLRLGYRVTKPLASIATSLSN